MIIIEITRTRTADLCLPLPSNHWHLSLLFLLSRLSLCVLYHVSCVFRHWTRCKVRWKTTSKPHDSRSSNWMMSHPVNEQPCTLRSPLHSPLPFLTSICRTFLSLLPWFIFFPTLCRHNYQRRAFLSSSDEGMLETFTKYCHTTMSEIVDAAFRCPLHLLPPASYYNLNIHPFKQHQRIIVIHIGWRLLILHEQCLSYLLFLALFYLSSLSSSAPVPVLAPTHHHHRHSRHRASTEKNCEPKRRNSSPTYR